MLIVELTKPTPAQEERFKRWADIINSNATNTQSISEEAPIDEERFLRLTIVVADKEWKHAGTKEFVVAHIVSDVVNRKRKYAEYFTTGQHNDKIGVSIEWCKREDAWKNLSDKEIERIGPLADEAHSKALTGKAQTIDFEKMKVVEK